PAEPAAEDPGQEVAALEAHDLDPQPELRVAHEGEARTGALQLHAGRDETGHLVPPAIGVHPEMVDAAAGGLGEDRPDPGHDLDELEVRRSRRREGDAD